MYGIKWLEQLQADPQSQAEPYSCSVLLAPHKPVRGYQCPSPATFVLSANAINKCQRMVLACGTAFGGSTQACSYSDIHIYWVLRLASLSVPQTHLWGGSSFTWKSIKCFFSISTIRKWSARLKFGPKLDTNRSLANTSLRKYSFVLGMEGSDKF